MQPLILRVAIDTPLDNYFDYRWVPASEGEVAPQAGQLALVPFGRRKVMGLIVDVMEKTEVPEARLRDVIAVRREVMPVSSRWMDLCRFAAGYYQRPLGEVALPSLPKNLRTEKTVSLARALKANGEPAKKDSLEAAVSLAGPELNKEQKDAVSRILGADGFSPILLYGITGSGKTEVYLSVFAQLLESRPDAVVMILVPEINLTPQLEDSIRMRFPGTDMALLHSRLSERERLQNWLAAHTGRARIVLGTRMAVLASVPRLDMIVVDEEHDPSYKQQEGLRYSARDLAVWRAWQMKIPVVLGSATPSLETWHHAALGRYSLVTLPRRAASEAVLPDVRLIDTSRASLQDGFTPSLLEAVKARLERKEQSLLFLNRRGYAPVLMCEACGWISTCRRCTAYMVLHKPRLCLRCHHCGLEHPVLRACPDCGYVDLKPLGRGTQRIEESLQQHFPTARILRIDADSTRKKGSMEMALEQVHRGEADILVGTQMIAKGHDFKKLTLVGVVNPDTALFSHDYRAGERLFAQLMQVGGRAGRHVSGETGKSEVLIQTRYPHHPLYQAVLRHDYDGFASSLLKEREQAGLPPFMYQALLCAEARQLEKALDFLGKAAALAVSPGVFVNEPVPMAMMRVGGMERAQLLVEAGSRADMQPFLRAWLAALRALKTPVRWHIEVDPAAI
ncbi:MAG: primosomal protein N' [Alistipes senegalensis]|nr:primosomal protein N' [Oxalobacter formigenes]MCM1280644.1 primosomal protein N' [Alistipes senegalensis]